MSDFTHFANMNTLLATRLNDNKNLSSNALQRAKSLADTEKLSLDHAIQKLGLMDENELLPILADLLDCKFVMNPNEYTLEPELTQTLTLSYCKSKILAPITSASGQILILTSDPANLALMEELCFFVDQPFEVAISPTRAIRALLATAPGAKTDGQSKTSNERLKADQETLRQAETDGPVIRFVADVFNDAVATDASDIHFEPQEDGLRIRMRRNGLLHVQPVDSSLNMTSILARVKVMAAMNVSERRLPQDGRISSNIGGRKVDFRVSSVPTSFGESIVCRVLDPKSLRLGWDALGFDAATTRQIIDVIEQPSGLFLVTGPTGSGKTTTLYTALAYLNQADRKIVTVEDPIEYDLPGVEQVQVHEEIGMSFAKALRSFLRQDPNIIMVGEIRDEETAEIACRAALVGRMVLSTLHTNAPEGALTRLKDLKVPEYIIKEVLRGVLGQKLEIVGGGQRVLSATMINAESIPR